MLPAPALSQRTRKNGAPRVKFGRWPKVWATRQKHQERPVCPRISRRKGAMLRWPGPLFSWEPDLANEFSVAWVVANGIEVWVDADLQQSGFVCFQALEQGA